MRPVGLARLLDLGPFGLSDCRTFGLPDFRTFGLSPDFPPDFRTCGCLMFDVGHLPLFADPTPSHSAPCGQPCSHVLFWERLGKGRGV
eukprot:scaffold391_cov223-Pinguiococcus_pyrenoidosus.AAC.15